MRRSRTATVRRAGSSHPAPAGRWSFGPADARDLPLATHIGEAPLTHGHGAPCRLVAPGRRGLQWVRWVERVEVHEDPDPGAVASTVWSSFTAAGRPRGGGRATGGGAGAG